LGKEGKITVQHVKDLIVVSTPVLCGIFAFFSLRSEVQTQHQNSIFVKEALTRIESKLESQIKTNSDYDKRISILEEERKHKIVRH